MQKNENKKKEQIIFAAIILIIALAVGIAAVMRYHFDAVEYTQAVLDVTYKGQTKNYMRVANVSQESAKSVFEENLNLTMQEFQNLELSEELEKNYRELFRNVINQVSYTVNTSEKTDEGNYEVEVTVRPMLLFDVTYEKFQRESEAYAKKITEEVMKGSKMPGEKEIQNKVYQIYYEILSKTLTEGSPYGKPEKMILHVNRIARHTYKISEKDIEKLNEKLISREILKEKQEKKNL